MAHYLSHGLTLKVNTSNSETASYLDQLLQDLSWARTDRVATNASIYINVGLDSCNARIPTTARELFRADGFCGFEIGDDFYLSDGSTTFHQHPPSAQGDVSLSPSFFAKPSVLQRNFWAFALIKLLRSLSIFSLHAAGVTRHGRGVLIVGSPGSGKSTLAIGLVRLGWKYLSDDALLLRDNADQLEALAFRKSFYVDTDAASDYTEIPLGGEVPDSHGGMKRRLNIEEVYPAQHEQRCDPRVLLFSRIVSDLPSLLVPVDRVIALKNLLKQCSPQLAAEPCALAT
jgi:hypothetical protein